MDFFHVNSEQAGEKRKSAGAAGDAPSALTPQQQAQAEIFGRLFTGVLTESRIPAPQPGGFAVCHATFSGADGELIEEFIDAVEVFKDFANISEENALRGLSTLLKKDAFKWWQGVRSAVSTWDDAVLHLRSAFGDIRPPYRIYQELFTKSQAPQESTQLFVAKARSLLASIPAEDLTEKAQLDIVYGLLNSNIRRQIKREEFSDFRSLIQKARNLKECQKPRPDTAKGHRAARRRASKKRASGAKAAAPERAPPALCRHKIQSRASANNTDQSRKPRNKKSCNRCGESGLLRSNCSKCHPGGGAVASLPPGQGSRVMAAPGSSAHGKHATQLHLVLVSLIWTSATGSLQRRQDGWLDKMVQYQKQKFIEDVNEVALVQITAAIKPRPDGYVDSPAWDIHSVSHLLALIRHSNGTEPVQRALRRSLNPPARRFLSYPKSLKYFPSLSKTHPNYFYYHIASAEMYSEERPPLDDAVLYISNPVEARLPSAQISVRLLKEILEARAEAGRAMPSTTRPTISWIVRSTTPSGSGNETANEGDAAEGSTLGGEGDGAGEGAGGEETAAPE